MGNEALISVIIPVYNAENCIENCLQSVLDQSYRNLEIILIDDGSIDNSGKISDAYSTNETLAQTRMIDMFSIYNYIRIAILIIICNFHSVKLTKQIKGFRIFYNFLFNIKIYIILLLRFVHHPMDHLNLHLLRLHLR